MVVVASAALCLVLVFCALLLLAGVSKLPAATAKAVCLRASMVVFVAAGTQRPGGWLGDVLHHLVAAVNHLGNHFGRDALGTGAMWIVWAVLCVLWAAGFLPTKWISWDPPDWLAVIGFFLPAAAAAIPGAFGDVFRSLFEEIGSGVTDLALGIFGG